MFKRIREYWQDYKAWRRGERRIAPYGSRGRIYERKNVPAAAHVIETKTTYRTLARVIRADGRPDEHYDLSDGTKLSPNDFDALKGSTNHG